MKRRVLIAAYVLALVGVNGQLAAAESLAEKYGATARKIIDATMADNDAWDKMEVLCLEIGHRLSGSTSLERAIDWAEQEMFVDQLERVRTEKLKVPYWTRGPEAAALTKPRAKQLAMLGLGGSIGTPTSGVSGDVVIVETEEELLALGDKVNHKIVLFNNKMPPYDPVNGSGYGKAVRFRRSGAVMAAKQGAKAVLVRSLTTNSLRTPHTGALQYDDAVKKIPAAAISTEDADMIAGLVRRGLPVAAILRMNARSHKERESKNVIGELRGSTHPDEIVLIGAHLDSWDVGHGAHDDAAGCAITMEALRMLRKLDLRPRRTIRVVLFTNEENGLRGGKHYAETHSSELANHVVAIESDSGAFAPRGYSIDCNDESRRNVAVGQVQEIMSLLSSLGTLNAKAGFGGPDIGPMKDDGVILMGHRVDGSKYFDYHHSPADTLDKVDPTELSQNVAAMAVTAYILADMPQRLGER